MKRYFVWFACAWIGGWAWLCNSKSNMIFADPASSRQLKLIVRASYLPGIPVLVRVEIVREDGSVDRDIWDATATLSIDNPGLSLDRDQITLRNGLGSILVTFTGSGDFTLTADVAGLQDSRSLLDWQNETILPAALDPDDSTLWSGIISIQNDLAIPSGHTLTIQPGTLILVEGVSSGTGGKDLIVQGTIESLGSETAPVTITAEDPAKAWGYIFHDQANPSLYQYTNITRAGHAPGVGGHTGAPPALRPRDSQITFQHCSITDHDGKIMSADGSDLIFQHCHLARAVMGPETHTTGLLFEDSYITEMFGANDNDAIYVHRQQDGQSIVFRRAVLAAGDDDGLDTLGPTVRVEDSIIRDFYDKGVSINKNDYVWLDHVLIVNNEIGIAAKNGHPFVHLDHVTIACRDTGEDIGIYAYRKQEPDAIVEYFVSHTIVVANDPVKSDYVPANSLDPLIRITYSNIYEEDWPGLGNINVDPLFVDSANHDYRLQSSAGSWDPNSLLWMNAAETSRCIDAGNPGSLLAEEPPALSNLRVNLGYFGGTTQASKTPNQWSLLADLDNDGLVSLSDYARQSFDWRKLGTRIPGDLDRNGAVEASDLMRADAEWLRQTS